MPLRALFRPSLSKRLLLALMLAFVLIWGALFAWFVVTALWRGSGDIDTHLAGTAQALVDTLEEAGNPQEAARLMAALEAIQRRQIAFARAAGEKTGLDVYFAAYDAQGRPVHLARDMPALELSGLVAGYHGLSDGQHPWHVITAASANYRVHILDRVDLRRREVFREVAPDLLGYVALAFVIVLVAALLAIRTGLAPLRRLSAWVAARRPDDLSPLDLPVKHRELLPLSYALNTLLARARAAIAREQSFTQDAAHELRTPLAVIGAQAHVLARAANEAERQAAAERLQAALERASRVSGQLLALAQLEGTAMQQSGSLELMAAISEAIADFSARDRLEAMEFALDGPDALRVQAQAPALRSILDNLFDNAARHGHARHMDVAVSAEADRVRVTFRDDGRGIAAGDRERIFERFHRGHDNGAPGAGLGLTIARQAAEGMGGDLVLGESTPGGGTVFELRLRTAESA